MDFLIIQMCFSRLYILRLIFKKIYNFTESMGEVLSSELVSTIRQREIKTMVFCEIAEKMFLKKYFHSCFVLPVGNCPAV